MCKLLRCIGWLGFGYAGVVALIAFWPVSAMLVAFIVLGILAKNRRQLWAYGTARFATLRDCAKLVRARRGLLLGRLWTGKRKPGPLVRLPDAIHTMVVAPTGVGKGVSFVIPELLSNRASMVVVDFKGDLAKATSEHRRRRMGHRVVLLDPFHVVTK